MGGSRESQDTLSVLTVPKNQRIEEKHYAISYNFQSALYDAGVDVTAVVRQRESDSQEYPYSVIETGRTNTLSHRLSERSLLTDLLSNGEFDVLHQQHLPIHSFSPTLLSAADEIDQPIIVGALEAGHTIPPSHFKNVVIPKLVGTQLPDMMADALYPILQTGKHAVQPARDTLFRKSLNVADCVVFPNNATEQIYRDNYLESSTDTAVIPFGIRYDEFTPRNDYTSNDIVCVGRLSERKGQDQLIRAMPNVLSEVPDARLILIGKGILRGELEELAVSLGVQDSVEFRGYVPRDELTECLSTAGVFAHPTHSDSYFFARLEAMACARPVVGTNLPGADEITTHGETGFLFEPNDIRSISKYCVELLSDPDRAAAFGKTARRVVEENHDWSKIVSEYSNLYEEYL